MDLSSGNNMAGILEDLFTETFGEDVIFMK